MTSMQMSLNSPSHAHTLCVCVLEVNQRSGLGEMMVNMHNYIIPLCLSAVIYDRGGIPRCRGMG